MSARPLVVALLGFVVGCAGPRQNRESRESELSAALTDNVGRLDELDERFRQRLSEPFVQDVGADGELTQDALVPCLDMADSLMMGTQAAQLIEVLTAVHVHSEREADRALIESIARKRLGPSMFVVAHAANCLEAEAALLAEESDERKLGFEAVAALRETYKTCGQLEVEVLHDHERAEAEQSDSRSSSWD